MPTYIVNFQEIPGLVLVTAPTCGATGQGATKQEALLDLGSNIQKKLEAIIDGDDRHDPIPPGKDVMAMTIGINTDITWGIRRPGGRRRKSRNEQK